ncbi:MAG: M3 family metallopeptidase, partial [Flavicella sp.]|nr:M3 family metallopeptidase [Flavicella sp.]
MSNPLLENFDTPFESTPFSKIKTEHFIPALKHSIDLALDEIDTVVKNTATPSFENTLEALENCGNLIGRNSSLLFNLNSAETSDALQKVAQEAAPLLTAFQNDIRLNETLFKRIKFVYEKENRALLSPEQLTLLEKEYKGFVRNGALLDNNAKEKLRGIDTALAQLSLSFGEHVLADTQAYQLHIEKEEDLKGLPDNSKEMAKQLAEQKGLKGWSFTLDYPSYMPFMTYSEHRELRKKLSLAFGKRGFQDNDQNNSEVIIKIVKLRQERAQLLGYESHAAFVLEERMAQSEKNVQFFLDNLSEKAHPAAKKEWG